MFGWKAMAGYRAFAHYFQKFSMEDNAEVLMSLNTKRRSWITRLWENAQRIEPPFINIQKE